MYAKQSTDARLPSQDALLLDYVRRLDRHRADRVAVHVHLSRLLAQNRRERHLLIAATTFAELIRTYEGQLFALSNGDLLFIGKTPARAALDSAVVKLRYLFGEDPVVQIVDSSEPDRFCTWYELEKDYAALLAAAQAIAAEEQRRRAAPVAAAAPAQPALKPLQADTLGQVLQSLARADLSNLVRRQSVCALLPESAPQAVFDEVYVSIADLQRAVAPGIDLTSNRWLFQHLTETLDKRMLATLSKLYDAAAATRFSLNMNIATVLSDAFLAFDGALSITARGTMVLEFQAFDIFADFGAYLFARDFARERGYRICVDGLSYVTAPFIDRERLGLDFVKVVWSPEIADGVNNRRLVAMRDLVNRSGVARVILCRCDNDIAVRVGQALGISLFQGRHVDGLLAAMKRGAAPGKQAAVA